MRVGIRGGVALAAGLGWVGALPVIAMAQGPSSVLATARDGVTVHGEVYFGGLGAAAPLSAEGLRRPGAGLLALPPLPPSGGRAWR